jgi:hypothetical protein
MLKASLQSLVNLQDCDLVHLGKSDSIFILVGHTLIGVNIKPYGVMVDCHGKGNEFTAMKIQLTDAKNVGS